MSMSTPAPDSATRFLNDLLTNETLRQKVEAAAASPSSPESFRALVASEGYPFTREEWQAAVSRLSASEDANADAVSDEELEEIAGGFNPNDLSAIRPKVKGWVTTLGDLLSF